MTGVRQTARSARRAIAVTAGVGVGALLAQSLPVALAAKDATTVSTPVVSVEAPSAAHTRRAERAAKAEAAPPPPPPAPLAAPAPQAPSEAAAGARKHHAQGTEAPSTTAPTAPVVAAGGARHGDGHVPAAHAHGRAVADAGAGTATSDASAAVAATGAGTAAASTGRTATQDVEALARKQKKTGGEKGGGKKRKEKERELKEREQAEHEHEGSPTGEGEGTSGHETGTSGAKGKPTSVGVEAGLTAPATASAPAGTPAPAGGTGEASLSAFVPSTSAAQGLSAGGALAKHAARPHRHAGAAAAKRTPAATGVAALAPLALLASSGGSGSGAAPHPRSGLGGSYSRSSEPALVHTITKIVGVVPGPVRILIAALAALALALGLRSLLTGVRARRLARQRGELLEDVGLLQAALLPEPPARLGPVGTSVAYRPADGPGAGGDFYDVFAVEAGELAVIVGDVSGHGRDALPHTALVRFTVRAYLEAGLEPAAALATAGAVLERQLGGSFATVLAAVYHPRERTLTYAAAGHPPPLVLGDPDASGSLAAIAPVTACSAPPLGAGMRTGTRQTVVSIPGPARLCFHTDGVTEARVGERREELFGAERLSRSLAQLPAQDGAEELLDSVAAQSSARPDDMAACLLHVHDGTGAPAIASERVELERDSFAAERVRRFLHESGVGRAQAQESVERAALELQSSRTATLELSFAAGAPVVAVHGEVVIRAAALSAVGAS